jgi:hypothetical protein
MLKQCVYRRKVTTHPYHNATEKNILQAYKITTEKNIMQAYKINEITVIYIIIILLYKNALLLLH